MAGLFFSINIHNINGRHQDKKLLEIQSCKFDIGHHFVENRIDHIFIQFLAGSLAVGDGLF
jgi:hypothetical protein